MVAVDLPLAEMSDSALVIAVGRYDEAAMGELYRRHGRNVYGLAHKLMNDADRAEEVLQDVFVRLWREPQRFDPARGELRSYLLRETHGRAVDRIRSDVARARREDRHQREQIAPMQDIEREVWELIRSETVKSAVATLSPGERDAITLAYFEGRTYREVATILGEPEGTIKSRIRLGMRKLADALESAGFGAR